MPAKDNRLLRVGVLGCGPIAQAAHFESCTKARNATLHAICDVADDLRARMAATHAPERQFADYDAMLADPDLEAVIIATSDAFHVPAALKALQAGKHVLCEKPLAMDVAEARAMFDAARRLRIGFHLGSCELDVSEGRKRRFNTSILVGPDGEIIGKYRKIHLPGGHDHIPGHPFQNLEKRYFEVGNLGWPVWNAFGGKIGMMICNDRRWPEAYRVMGLQGVELIVLGYNTPVHNPAMPETDDLGNFHNELVMSAGAYQNGTFVVGVAKAGVEEGVDQIGQSCAFAPSGELIARCVTLGD
jgi:predicted amidohydrolase